MAVMAFFFFFSSSFFFNSSVNPTDGRYGVVWLGTWSNKTYIQEAGRQGEQEDGIPKISSCMGMAVVWINSSMRPVQKQKVLNFRCKMAYEYKIHLFTTFQVRSSIKMLHVT